MGRAQNFALTITATKSGAPPSVKIGPQTLAGLGCNLMVEVATASAFVSGVANPSERRSIQVMAHLDTGAAKTTLSSVLAEHLGLVQTGVVPIHTANGTALTPTFAVDIAFVGTTLAPFANLPVGSCTLQFTVAAHTANPRDPKNMGLLIGRDIMSRWNITWDGPTSTVFISD